MRALYAKLPTWNWTPTDLASWRTNIHTNDFGFAVDMELTRAAISTCDLVKASLQQRTNNIAHADFSVTQRDQLKKLLAEHGVKLPDMTAATLERRLDDPDLPEPARELMLIRLQMSQTSNAKWPKLLASVSTDGRLRGTSQFCGASRTGRDSGRIFQPLNLPRPPKHLKKEIDLGIEFVKSGIADLVYENPMELTSAALRGALIAPPGAKLCIADLNAIEGRVAAWLAGEEWKVQAYRDYDAGTGPDLYVLAYSTAFHVAPTLILDDVAAGGNSRQVGKVMELACIAEGQLVTTDQGMIPIENVGRHMRVWDGVAFVKHGGVVCRGIRDTLNYEGLTATADHQVWVEGSSTPIAFSAAIERGFHLQQSRPSRKAIWKGCSAYRRAAVQHAVANVLRVLPVRNLFYGEVGLFEQLITRCKQRLSTLLSTETVAYTFEQAFDCGEATLHKPPRQRLEELRWPGHPVFIPFDNGCGSLGNAASWIVPTWPRIGSDRQQRKLRTRQPAMVNSFGTDVKFSTRAVDARLESHRMALFVRPDDSLHSAGVDARTDIGQSAASGKGEAKELACNRRKVRVFDILNAGPRNRFTVSGVLVHNCGFGGAVGAFSTMMSMYGVSLSEAEIIEVVRAWRRANSKIVAFWYELEDAIKRVITSRNDSAMCNSIEVRRDGAWLRLVLPSGRSLCYAQPQIVDRQISYLGMNNYTRKWERITTYGGKCFENVVQATARDLMVHNVKLCADACYTPVLTVYDEIVAEVPDFPAYNSAKLEQLLATVPEWAPGLPLAASGFETYRYRKD